MKTWKIFALPSHTTKERTSGVDFARIIQPMKALDGYSLGNTKFEVRLYDSVIDLNMDWRNIVKDHDAIYFNYTVNPWAFAHMGLAARQAGIPLILDIDDSLWDVMSDNPSYSIFQKGSEAIKNFTSICNEVDFITTTNYYLKNVIIHNTRQRDERVKSFPNYIDLDNLYTTRTEAKNNYQISLLHFGSTTHFNDLANDEFSKGLEMVMKDNPQVVFKTVGAMMGDYQKRWGARYSQEWGHKDIYGWIKERYPEVIEEADICVVPLIETLYNRCKSSIKFIEMSAAKKPGVYQDIRQYQEVVKHGENGFLARTAQEWCDSINKLVNDVELRRSMGQKAFDTVEKDWQVKNHVKDYAEYFDSILTNWNK